MDIAAMDGHCASGLEKAHLHNHSFTCSTARLGPCQCSGHMSNHAELREWPRVFKVAKYGPGCALCIGRFLLILLMPCAISIRFHIYQSLIGKRKSVCVVYSHTQVMQYNDFSCWVLCKSNFCTTEINLRSREDFTKQSFISAVCR